MEMLEACRLPDSLRVGREGRRTGKLAFEFRLTDYIMNAAVVR